MVASVEWEPRDIEEAISAGLTRDMEKRALAAAHSGRLVRIHDEPPIYVYMGEHGDHVIVGGVFCSCEAFYFSHLRGKPGCYHVYAARMAGDSARSLRVGVDTVLDIIGEVLNVGLSSTLRRLLIEEDSG